MNTFSLLFQVVIAFVAVNCQQNCLQQQLSGVNIGQLDQQLLESHSNSGASASANAAANSGNSLFSNNGQLATGPGGLIGQISGPGGLIGPVSGPGGLVGQVSGPMVGQISGPINAPYNGLGYNPAASRYNYATVDPRSQNTQVSESYHSNKGEILIHRPAPIIVKRPPTKVLVNHPPIVVKPAPVVLHKPPPVIMRKVFVKQHPRPVKVEPVYVNVVKPPAEKYFVNEKSAQGASGVGYNQGQSYLQGPSAAQLQGAGQFSSGPAQFTSGPAQFTSGPVQFSNGPAQFSTGPAQFVTGPGQFSFQGQSQSQSGAEASASAHSDTDSHNQQLSLQSNPTQGCY